MADSLTQPNTQKEETAVSKANQSALIKLPAAIDELLEDVPEPQRQAVKAAIVAISSTREWHGPHLPPDILKQYNDAFPKGAERVFEEGQRQTLHRIDTERRIVASKLILNERGQIFGFTIAIAFLVVASFLIYNGHETAGTIIGSADLIALVAVFVLGKLPGKKPLENKDEEED